MGHTNCAVKGKNSLWSEMLFNISTWRKRGLASNPLFRIPGFFLHFSLELSYSYLRFEGNGKIPLGIREKSSALLAISV